MRVGYLCLQTALLVLGGVWLANEPGTVTIVWREWRVDAQIGILVFLIVCLVMFGITVYRSWQLLRHGPMRLLASHRLGRERKGYRELTRGMVSLAAGDASEALRHAYKADSLLNEPNAGHLLIAEAAKLQGKMALAKEHYEAMSQTADAALAGLRGLFEHAVLEGDHATALKLGAKIRELKKDSIWLLPRYFQLKVAVRDWEGADEVLEDAIRRKAVPTDGGKRDRAYVLFERGKSALHKGDTATAIGFLREANDLHPGFWPAAIEYARLLGEEGRKRRALRVLEQAWSWGGAFKPVAEEYIRLEQAINPGDEYKLVKKLTAVSKNDPDALLILSEFAFEARLWGETRRHLEAFQEVFPSENANKLLEVLEDVENDNTAAVDQWWQAAATAAGDKVWICTECHNQFIEWKSCCDSCNSFGLFKWQRLVDAPSTLVIEQQKVIPLLNKLDTKCL